jgi:predicted amidohydrolase YtcJ
VTPLEAMKMITLWGAEQYGEQASKGSLEAGKLADMVVLSDNPLTIDPMKINTIVVLETIKDGKTVYARQP